MIRLGLQGEITEYLPLEPFLPAAGQGALAVEARLADSDIIDLVASLEHTPTRQAVTAERTFLKAMGGGCHAPVAALGMVNNDALKLEGMVAGTLSRRVLRASEKGNAAAAGAVGEKLARKMRAMGAAELVGEAVEA
jgi:hydroxymethylbilane synthase